MTGFIETFSGAFGVGTRQFYFQIFADVHGLHTLVTHVFQRVLHGFPLWIQNRFFRRNYNLCFHQIGRRSPLKDRWILGKGLAGR